MTARVTRNVLVSVAASCVFLCCSASSAGTRNGSLQDSTCNQADCLRCDLDTAECLKCLYVMMEDDRTCLEACPEGFSTTWSYSNNYVGRVCTARSLLSFITGRDVAIIAGAAVGGAICVGVVIGALLYMRRRTKQAAVVDSGRTSRAPRIWKDKRVSATEVEVDEVERSAFLEQLSSLEGEAHNFLEMLNETRNRFRKLGGADSTTDTKAKAYRAVLRDLSRVLSLLNRSEYHLRTVPADWRRLVAWATRVLARYKRQKAAREAGEIPSIEPLSSASGGTLYQTRRQIQEERRRQAATQALSCCLHGRCQGADRPHGAAVHDVGTGAVGAGFSVDSDSHFSSMGSRSASRLSLGPVIFEEDEDEEDREGYSLDSSKDDQSSYSNSTEDEVHSEETEESELKESDVGEGEKEEKEDEDEIDWVYDVNKVCKDANDNNVPGFSTRNGKQRNYITNNNNNNHSNHLFKNQLAAPSNMMMNLKNVMNMTIGDGESNFFSALEGHVAKPRPCPPRRDTNIMFENEKKTLNNKNNNNCKNVSSKNKRNSAMNKKIAKQQKNLQRQRPVQTKRNTRVSKAGSLDAKVVTTDTAPCGDDPIVHASTSTSTRNKASAYENSQKINAINRSLTQTSKRATNIVNNNPSTDSSVKAAQAPEDTYLEVIRMHTPTTGFRSRGDPFRDDTLDDSKNNNLVTDAGRDLSGGPSNNNTTDGSTSCKNSDNRNLKGNGSLVDGKTQNFTGVADFARTLLTKREASTASREYEACPAQCLSVPRCELTTDL